MHIRVDIAQTTKVLYVYYNAQKMSEYGFFSGQSFPVFGHFSHSGNPTGKMTVFPLISALDAYLISKH